MRTALDLPERYAVATMHRPSNVDDPGQAARIVAMLDGVAGLLPLIVPLHPRGRPTLEAAGLRADDRLRVVDPLGYVDFLSLVRGAALVVTDSGGIQEETTILRVPCLTVRPNTERPITISHGTNRLVEADGVVPIARAILDGDLRPARRGAAAVGRPCRGTDRGRRRYVARASQGTTSPRRWAGRSRDRDRRRGYPSGNSTPSVVPVRRASPTCRVPRPGRRPVPGGSVTQDRRVAVIGLGYVGLPLAIAYSEAGLEVEGVDASPDRIAELQARTSPIDDISDERLGAALDRGMRVGSPVDSTISEADAIFVCVPTPITATKDPDLAPVLSAAETICGHIRAGQLIVLQSTTFPGTTTGPFAEVVERSGLKAGVDFDLAFAPERVNPGDPASASKGVPRLVGATTPQATKRAAALLRNINDQVVELSSPDAAELAKLLENVFRNINIAFVNQLALLCERMGLDVWEVINAAATKPFGFMKFTPGPGVGGHCIPVDPYYLSWRAREFDFIDRFIEAAGDINFAMPRHVVDLVAEALNDRERALKGAKVGVLGVAFKPNVQDARNSPAADVLAGIAERGAEVRYHDPHVSSFRDSDGAEREDTPLDELLDWADAIVVVTAHRAIDWPRVYERADLVVDTVDSSAGHATRPRQVLRLGAGWSARP